YAAFFFGTFAPFFRASERPIAIACFRLVTLPPLPPLPDRSVPCFLRRMALATVLPAALPYFRRLDFFFVAMVGSPYVKYPPLEMVYSADPKIFKPQATSCFWDEVLSAEVADDPYRTPSVKSKPAPLPTSPCPFALERARKELRA